MTGFNSARIAPLLQQAVALHRQGKCHDAQALYRQVLLLDPAQFDALHLSGVVARQLGDADAAVDLIAHALRVNPAQAAAHCNLGAALQDAGRPRDALASYDRAVQLHPQYALAFCNRGNALRKLGQLNEALASYDRALAIQPAYPEAHCNRAIALQDVGRAADALSAAGQALAARPNYAEAWCARGNALQSLQQFDAALHSYDRAIALKPDRAEAHCWRGTALQRLRQFDLALADYERALALRPDYPLAHQYRGNALRALMRKDEAIAAYRRALAQGGDAAAIGYALAALGAGDAPAAAPADYVKSLFDQYADHFDQHLVDVLAYRMPALLDAAIRRATTSDHLDTLDLGCGTGLCGPYLRPYSRSLTGVDLSGKMLDKARERGLYDTLACAELGAFLSGRADDCDLLVAADVLVYFGDLAPLFAQAHRALRAGGLFCFSVEAADGDGDDFALRASHRYAHSLPYLRRLAGTTGFGVLEAALQAGRQENGAHVGTYAMLLRRAQRADRATLS